MKKSVLVQVVAVGIVLVVGVLGASPAESQDRDPCNFYEDSTFGGSSCAGNGRGCMECNFEIDGDWITIIFYSPTPGGPTVPPRLGSELAAAVDLRESDDWRVPTYQPVKSVQALRLCAQDGRIFDALAQRGQEAVVPSSPVRARTRRYLDPVAAP